MATATDKVPNTSATAASSGSDLNGMAVQLACRELCERVRSLAAELLGGIDPAEVRFEDGAAHGPDGGKVVWSELAKMVWWVVDGVDGCCCELRVELDARGVEFAFAPAREAVV